MTMLVTERGVPTPPSEIVRRIQQVNPALGLKFLNGKWAIMHRWKPDDPRRVMIRKGEMALDDDFDVYGYLPLDCAVDEAYGYIVNAFRAWRGTKSEVADLLDRVAEYNREQGKRNGAGVLEYADELIETNKHTLGRAFGVEGVKPVYQSESLATTPGRRRKKGREE